MNNQPRPEDLAPETLSPEETAQQEEEAQLARELGLKTVRDLEASYQESIEEASQIIDAFQQSRIIDLPRVESFVKGILFLHKNFEGSLLLENMQAALFNERYYPRHMVNVSLLNVLIGSLLNASANKLALYAKIGTLIDFGMLNLSEQILDRNYRLNDNERVRIHQHTQAAMRLLKSAGETSSALLDAVLYHHERYDGSGYPKGLRGTDIPYEARLTAVSDSFDAAISRKQFDKMKSPFEVLAEFSENPGEKLDPEITRTATMGLASMMVGRYVRMNDNSVGQVVEISPQNLAYPVVRIVGRRIQSGPELYPLSLTPYMQIR